MASHYEATLQRDIDLIRSKVLEMSALAERALKDGLQAVVARDRQAAYSVILRDQRIDELEKQIDRLCLEFLVRQQPVAGHLRFVYATIKINAELERIGDYAESIARQSLKVAHLNPVPASARFVEIANFSIPMLHDAVKAFTEQNAELARSTMVVEEKVDELRNRINAELIQLRQENKFPLEALTPLMTIARRFERVSDQAKNICEEVLYMCTGEYSKHKGTEVLRVLFVDEHNSCRSQMAEGIANSLDQPRLMFTSAGIDPRPVDPGTVKFLAEKGIDISRQNSKSVEQVPNLEHYQVIIVLAREAQKVLPPPPTKTVGLEWTVQDPSKVTGTPEQVRTAYEVTYQFICDHLNDLTEAILGDKID
ncbi:MAG: phosphate signaling complex protein PhoU [Verrucomicrobia subdivision 3 bacterium]|nr:phosphate signaling complex protein PhoU [Limisphaerales bacterium]